MRVLPQRFNKPELVLRPRAGARRVAHHLFSGRSEGGERDVRLRWDMTLTVRPEDVIGRSIASYGVFDLILSETVFRLLDPGDHAADVGANIGYVTGLMARRAGPDGRVTAFEPHPAVRRLLEANVARWASDSSVAAVDVRPVAVSNTGGSGTLVVSDAFATNMGVARLDAREGGDVQLTTLDEAFGGDELGLLKIDVEGHELAVLEGGAALFEAGRVRDVIFEDFGIYPTPLTEFLEARGYTVLSLDNTLSRPLARPAADHPPRRGWEGPSYLATLEPARVTDRLRLRGWAVLGVGRVEKSLARA